METALETNTPLHQQNVAPALGSVASLSELSDAEILEWLSARVFDDASLSAAGQLEGAAASDARAVDFWEQVSDVETRLHELGYSGQDSVYQAVALLTVAQSLESEPSQVQAQPVVPMDASHWIAAAPALAPTRGERELVSLNAELTDRARAAVVVALSLTGSAFRAVATAKG